MFVAITNQPDTLTAMKSETKSSLEFDLLTIAAVIFRYIYFLSSFTSDKPEMRDGPSVVTSWINHETEVTCEAEGSPAPEIVWSRKGTVTSSKTLNSCVSTLKFTPEEKDEFGSLLCYAKNLLGTGKKNITVKQLGKRPFHCSTWLVVSDQIARERRRSSSNCRSFG